MLLVGCSGNKTDKSAPTSAIKTAEGISITRHRGFTVVEVKNPWKAGFLLQTYVLVPRDSAMPKDLPKGTLVRTPVRKALVYSDVHGGLIKELGGLGSIKGVCDARYFNMPEIKRGIASNAIVDAGSSMAPSMEKIIALAPEVIILSPFQNAGYGTITSLGIPIIESADYMETTPLGRAEWIKFFGALYGKDALADSIYSQVSARYSSLKAQVSHATSHPKVISESVISGTWYVPGGNSYMAHFFTDAGASYPWAADKATGSLSLDMAQVLAKAHDADIWLLKSSNPHLSYRTFAAENPLNAQFKAYRQRHIYYCDTMTTRLYEDFPFHPERLLQEYIAIFHPEMMKGYKMRYFTPLPND